MNLETFSMLSTKKAMINEKSIRIYIKDLGMYAYFYGGTAIITKHWR